MRTVVAVLRGGPSSEYEVSLQTGALMLEHLNREKYEPRDIFISRKGEWHRQGVPMMPEKALRGTDVVLNAMHGEFGEDGGVQRLLEILKIPYTGSGTVSSALAFNKHRTREVAQKLGVKVARGVVVPQSDDPEKVAHQIFRTFPHPAIVKPIIGGSSVGITKAENFHSLAWGLEQAWKIAPKALIEEYISGKEATVGVIDGFRGEKTYALLPAEIIPAAQNPFYDYHAKYLSDETTYHVPGRFADNEKYELMRIAKLMHDGLVLSHYSRSDFIVSKRGIYFLEVNSLPGMTSHSLFPKGLQAIGATFSHFLDHIISLAKKT